MLRGSSNGQASRLTVASNRTSGSPAVGDILTATLPAGTVASSYQWVRDTGSGPTAISGATSSTYTLVSADIPPSSTTYKIYPMAVISSIFGDYTITSPPAGITNGIFVASRAQVPTNIVNIPVGFACQREHTSPSAGAISNLIFTDVFWYINDTFGVTLPSASLSMKKFVEYPRGTFTLVTYNSGVVNYTLSTTNLQQSSDPTSTVNIPAATKYWEHTLYLNTGGAADIPSMELPAGSSTLGVLDAKYAFTGNAPASQTAGTTSTFYFGAAVITGTIASSGYKSLFMSGDSILFGQGDITTSGANGSSGYLPRWADRQGLGYAKFAKMGMSASDLVALFTSSPTTMTPYFNLITAACTHHLTEWGTNDLRLGRSQANLTSDIGTIQSKTASKIYGQATLLNRTTSTDSWATTANQTVQTDGNWGALTAFNTAVRSLLPGSTFYVEGSDLASTSRNSGIWPAPPTPTLDGTHPVSTVAASIASGLTLTLP